MAFYATGLPSVAAAFDRWPMGAGALLAPVLAARSPALHSGQRAAPKAEATSEIPVSSPKPDLPGFLLASPIPMPSAVAANFEPILPAQRIQSILSNLGRHGLAVANPVSRLPPAPLVRKARLGILSFSLATPSSTLRRPLSTSPLLRVATLARFAPSPILPFPHGQRRGYNTNGISPSHLSSREQTANRHPNSPTVQNAFYQLLLKAGLPNLVIERYESGQFATNDAATEAYYRALRMVNPGGARLPGSASPAAESGMPIQNQIAAQATAARAIGHDVSTSTYHGGGGGGGANSLPITDTVKVITVESTREFVFRIFKWAAAFALVLYVSMTVVTLIIDVTTVVKRPGGPAKHTDYQSVKSQKQSVKFTDVHGCDEAKDELQELVEFLRNPSKFSNLGGKLPKGVLLVGPPGTGKTLLARAVAGEAGVPFFYMSGSEFDEVFVGVGAKRVRDLFASAKSKSPSIIFIDELDAIGTKRSSRDLAYGKQTLNQLLTELDGFDQSTGVIIIAATNFPKILDKALTRPGRFDRHIVVDLPDVRGRIDVLRHHASKVKIAKDVDLESLAAATSGLSGAELANIINQAAVRASRMQADLVRMEHLDWAKDKAVMGAERRSRVMSDKEKLMTAYHEAGHALVLLHNEELSTKHKLYKVTILPRGMSLGHTAFLPEMDSYSATATDLQSSIEVALGGKMAEELAYGELKTTTGVSNDLESATNHAFRMVTQYGMSKILGPVELGNRYQYLSSETRAQVEGEVQRLMNTSYENVRQILSSRRKDLDLLAQALVDYETLDRDEVERIIRGETLNRPRLAGSKIIVPVMQPSIGLTDGAGPSPGEPPSDTPGGIVTTPK